MTAPTYPFETALIFLKDGERVARTTWPVDVFLEVRERVGVPALVIVSPGNPDGTYYEPAATDLMADNWVML